MFMENENELQGTQEVDVKDEASNEPKGQDAPVTRKELEKLKEELDKKFGDAISATKTIKSMLAERNDKVGIDPNEVVTKQELADAEAFLKAGITDEEEKGIVRKYSAGRPISEALQDDNIQVILERYREQKKASEIANETTPPEDIMTTDKQFVMDYKAGKIEQNEANTVRYTKLILKHPDWAK